MRLTLRTLLAYLDDILEPSQAKEIGAKIAQSDFASTLTNRIRDVMRRRRLTAPDVEGTGGVDPNTVAEYLDNTLPPNAVAEVERVFLESDIHLAEVAAAHQILTLVLGEPVEIVPESRERMYALGPEPRHDAELAAAMEGKNGNGAATAAPSPPATIAPKTAVVKDFNESLPPQLRRKPFWKRAFPYVAVLALAAAFVGLVLTDPSLLPGLGFGETSKDNGPGGTNITANDDTKTPVVPNNERKSVPVKKSGPDSVAALTPNSKLPPLPEGVNGKAPPDVPEVPGGKVPSGKQPPIVGKQPPVKVATLPGMGKIPVPPGKVDPVNVVGQAPPIHYISPAGQGLLLKQDANGRDWGVVSTMDVVAAGNRLVAAAPFNSLLEIGSGDGRIALLPNTNVELLAPNKAGSFGLKLKFGRLVMSGPGAQPGIKPVAQPKKVVAAIQIRDELFRVELLTPETICGLEVVRLQPYRYEQKPSKDLYVGSLYVSAGSVQFSDFKGNSIVVAAAENVTGRLPLTPSIREANAGKFADLVKPVEAPTWLRANGEPMSSIADRYAKLYLKEFETDMMNLDGKIRIPVRDNAMAIVQDRRPLVSQYAAEALAATESYRELVKSLDVSQHEESRLAIIEGLRSWLLSDPENGKLLKDELSKVFPGANAEIVYRLLWGFNEADARDETKSELLVAWLGHGHIAIREMAFIHVHRLTGRRYEYRANLRPQQLALAFNQWKQHFNRYRALLPPKAEPKPEKQN